ncbi:MAG: L,D-transpeptidase [Acidobacteria bacterium]|nr:L,D-transpeptidase [Acidobacteriota bacterium]
MRGLLSGGEGGWALYPFLLLAALLLAAGISLPPDPLPAEHFAAEAERAELASQIALLTQETHRLAARYEYSGAEETYLVVDTAANRLYLYRGQRLLRAAVVSTGSGKVLASPDGSRWWVFETPRGVRRVLRKERNPAWLKPDWAFLEEGLPVPPPRDPSRVVRGILGAYALDLGEQVKIHGTTETEKLGQAASHGCIRVGDDDLEALYQATPVGARVFLY